MDLTWPGLGGGATGWSNVIGRELKSDREKAGFTGKEEPMEVGGT